MMDGYTLCGDRKINVIDTSTGLEVDVEAGEAMIVYDSATDTLFLAPTELGTFQYLLAFGLDGYPTIALSPIITIDLTIYDACLTTYMNEWSLEFESLSLQVGEDPHQMVIEEPTDFTSETRGLLDGYSACGVR